MTYSIINADAVAWANNYRGPLFHGMLLDPPYHLTIAERFGKEGSAPAKFGKDGVYARASRGFMNQEWDGGDMAFRPETWASFMNVLHPGTFCMAFAAAKNWPRMAVAIEDAGFINHPSVFMLGWNTAQGFPKATGIEVQMQKRRGVVPGMSGRAISNDAMENLNYTTRLMWHEWEVALSGHYYGGQAMKPAVEPIIVFQKPYSGRPIDCIIETGAGALNIDAGRAVLAGVKHDAPRGGLLSDRPDKNPGAGRSENEKGRWPANMALIHHPSCKPVGLKRVKAAGGDVIGDVVGKPKRNNVYSEYSLHNRWIHYGNNDGTETVEEWECHGDCAIVAFEGDARFYYQASWAAETQEGISWADPIKYVPKSSRLEREAGIEYREAKPVSDGRQKPIDNPYLRGETERKQVHPTLKPLALTKWLASLLLPSGRFKDRRLFVPCAGVASEMIGGVLAGWDHVTGVELGAEYAEIGRARLDYWIQTELKRPELGSDLQFKLF